MICSSNQAVFRCFSTEVIPYSEVFLQMRPFHSALFKMTLVTADVRKDVLVCA